MRWKVTYFSTSNGWVDWKTLGDGDLPEVQDFGEAMALVLPMFELAIELGQKERAVIDARMRYSET